MEYGGTQQDSATNSTLQKLMSDLQNIFDGYITNCPMWPTWQSNPIQSMWLSNVGKSEIRRL